MFNFNICFFNRFDLPIAVTLTKYISLESYTVTKKDNFDSWIIYNSKKLAPSLVLAGVYKIYIGKKRIPRRIRLAKTPGLGASVGAGAGCFWLLGAGTGAGAAWKKNRSRRRLGKKSGAGAAKNCTFVTLLL